MHKRSYYIINGITLYRAIAAPFLVLLIIEHKAELFRWLLVLSFFTDAIDGYLARRYKVTSILGAKLDSIADDLTIVAAIAGVFAFKPEFLRKEMMIFILLFVLFIFQTLFAVIRYGKLSSFHTYAAKTAAILQGVFLLLLFFLPEPIYWLFYSAAIVTALDLLEEILILKFLPGWESNVKGLWWVIKKQRK
jgi:CDP-diacylglycerol--glycerol-3-phosphate 3-phosphatidyltransferase